MNKQRQFFDLIIYIILIIVGVFFLVKGYHKTDIDLFPNASPTPQMENEWIVPDEQITYDYEFREQE